MLCSHLASPVMLNKIPKSSLKLQVTSFQPKFNSFKSPIQMDADWCVKYLKLLVIISTNILWKTKQWLNLNVLKQDSYYS